MGQEQAYESGTVKFFDTKKGFGFIKSSRGDEVFVHVSECKKSRVALEAEDGVRFVREAGRDGRPRAVSLTKLAPGTEV